MSHAAHRMHDNSLEAYRTEEAKLDTRCQEVLDWITKHGPHTDREVAKGMGFDHRSAVQPRISELIDANKLMEVGKVRCPITGKNVRRVDIRRARKPEQLVLVS